MTVRVREELSKYAATAFDKGIAGDLVTQSLRRGQEFIPEVFSAWFGNANNKLANNVMQDIMSLRQP